MTQQETENLVQKAVDAYQELCKGKNYDAGNPRTYEMKEGKIILSSLVRVICIYDIETGTASFPKG